MVSTDDLETRSVSSSVGKGSSCLIGVDFPSPRRLEDLRERTGVVRVCCDNGAWVRMISEIDGMTGLGTGGVGERDGGVGVGSGTSSSSSLSSSFGEESLNVRILSFDRMDLRLAFVKVRLEGFREAPERWLPFCERPVP